MDRSCELAAKAKYFAQRAAAVGDGGISSDDPDAVVKLFKEAEKLQALQSFMVEANKIVRAFWKAGVRDANSGDLWARYVGKLQDQVSQRLRDRPREGGIEGNRRCSVRGGSMRVNSGAGPRQ